MSSSVHTCGLPTGSSGSPNALSALFIVLGSISVFLSILSAIWIQKQSHVQVVRIRQPWTLQLTLVSFAATVALACAKAVFYVQQGVIGFSCTGYWFTYSILNSAAFSGLVVRGWMLVFLFNLERGLLNVSRRRVTEVEEHELMIEAAAKGEKDWYLNNRKLIKSKFILISIAVVMGVLLATVGGYFIYKPSAAGSGVTTNTFPVLNEDPTNFPCVCLSDHASYLFVDIPVGILIVAATVLLLRGLNNVTENFFLKEEIFNIGKLLVGTGVAITILFLPFVKKPIMAYDPSLLLILHVLVRYFFPSLALCWITAGSVIRLSYSWDSMDADHKVVVDSMIANLIPLKPTLNEMREEMFRLLFDEPGYFLFQEFLVKEFSIENLLFWKEAKDFREFASDLESRIKNPPVKPSSPTMGSNESAEEKALVPAISAADAERLIEARARKIFKSFCSDEAMFLINLPYSIQNRLRLTFVTSESKHLRNLTRNFSNKILNVSSSRLPVEAEASRNSHRPKKISSDTFTDALNEITNLMCSDSFRRFRMTDDYRKYVLSRYNREMDAINSGNVIHAKSTMIISSGDPEIISVPI